MFYKMNLSERSKKQAAEAERMVRDVVWTKQRSVQNLEGEIAGHAKRWALGDGYSAFLQYVNEKDRRILETIDKKEAAFSEMLTVDDISKAYEKDKASLVIVEGNNFIIKRGEHVGLVSANDLSDDMKAKIGMLKLVQDQQFVSTVGARVSVESYIVLDGANDDDRN
jgi:ATPase subunit of ABC transporter with duplicated ATPase domains